MLRKFHLLATRLIVYVPSFGISDASQVHVLWKAIIWTTHLRRTTLCASATEMACVQTFPISFARKQPPKCLEWLQKHVYKSAGKVNWYKTLLDFRLDMKQSYTQENATRSLTSCTFRLLINTWTDSWDRTFWKHLQKCRRGWPCK